MTDKKLLMLVDGHAVLHRAWHALPPLTTKDGTVVSGAYGFMMTLLSSIKKFKPTHLAVAFDLKGPTFRHQKYEEYKAGRAKKPDELYEQVPIIERVLRAMEVPVISAEGYEADDAIGTAATLATKRDKKIKVVIVTGDLDTLQLVDKQVRVYTMRRGLTDTIIYDPAQVKARYGLSPDQMVDFKALRGDPSDNIPGVKGIGEKTATELLQRFKTVDKLYKAINKGGKATDDLRVSVIDKLKDGHDDALEALDLCRIRTDAPIDFDLKSAVYQLVPRKQVEDLFEELQFNRLLRQWPSENNDHDQNVAEKLPKKSRESSRLPQDSRLPQATLDLAGSNEMPMVVISSADDMNEAVKKIRAASKLAFRTLITDDRPAFPEAAGLGVRADQDSFFFPSVLIEKSPKELVGLLDNPEQTKYCHDLKRELTAFTRLGLRISGPFHDLMLASYLMLAGERKSELGSLLAYYRNLPPEPKSPEMPEARTRLAHELEQLISLTDDFLNQVSQFRMTKLYDEIELPLTGALSRMEQAGVLIDKDYFIRLEADLTKRLDGLTSEIHQLAGGKFNINSPRQVGEVLFERLNLEAKGLKRTGVSKDVSTAASELEKLVEAHPIVAKILAYREAAKIKSTYVETLPALAQPTTDRIHARFNQAVTATGRLSSSDPNLQNIPTGENVWAEQVRRGFVAPHGCRLIAADYSQIELRIAAHLAGEMNMLEAFRRGEDIHWRTAVIMFGEDQAEAKRRVAKAINFGILYGMGANRLSASAGLSRTEAQEYIDQYFALHPGLARYVVMMKAKVAKDGYVETLFGRKRFFPNFRLMNRREQAEAERQAINTPMQGTQADMIKLAMIRLDEALAKRFGQQAKMIIQVHDELIFEVKDDLVEEAAALIAKTMKGVAELEVPIEVDVKVGRNWGEMKALG